MRAWAANDGGEVVYTLNGGARWQRVAVAGFDTFGSIQDVDFFDASLGWAVGRHEFFGGGGRPDRALDRWRPELDGAAQRAGRLHGSRGGGECADGLRPGPDPAGRAVHPSHHERRPELGRRLAFPGRLHGCRLRHCEHGLGGGRPDLQEHEWRPDLGPAVHAGGPAVLRLVQPTPSTAGQSAGGPRCCARPTAARAGSRSRSTRRRTCCSRSRRSTPTKPGSPAPTVMSPALWTAEPDWQPESLPGGGGAAFETLRFLDEERGWVGGPGIWNRDVP